MLIAILATLAALAGGLDIGYFDGHVTEVSVTLGLTLALNFLLAAISPRGAWRYPLISVLAASTWIWLNAGTGNSRMPHTIGSYAALNAVLLVAAAVGYAGATGSRRQRTSRTA